MRTGFRISSLAPSGLAVESVSDSPDSIILTVRSEAGTTKCPLCGTASRRIHSRYARQVADLPSSSGQGRLPESLHFAESDVILGAVRARSVHKVDYGRNCDWAAA